MIKERQAEPEKSWLEGKWDEICRLMDELSYDPYIDDQIEIDMIWELAEEIIKSEKRKEASWEARKKIVLAIIQGDGFDEYGVIDPMTDLLKALPVTKDEKLACADLVQKYGDSFMKRYALPLFRKAEQN